MRISTQFKCRNCNKINNGKIYCDRKCKGEFYKKLNSENNINPEEFIKEELEKPINDLFLKLEPVSFIPAARKQSKWREMLILLDKDLIEGEIRRLVYSSTNINQIRDTVKRYNLSLKISARVINKVSYVYFTKQKDLQDNED